MHILHSLSHGRIGCLFVGVQKVPNGLLYIHAYQCLPYPFPLRSL